MTTKVKLLDDTVIIPTGSVATTQGASDNTTKVATTAYVTTALANLADSAPSTLNTLNELAAALGDDANFSTTVTNSIAAKLPLAGGTLTGNLTLYSSAPVLAIKDGGTHGTNSTPYLEFRDGSSVQSSIGITNTAGDLSVWNTKNTTLRFATNNTQRMTIDSAGKVGIGTDTPANKLHVKAGASGATTFDARYNLTLEDDGENYIGIYSPSNSFGGVRFVNAANSIRGYIDYYHGSQGDKMQIYAQNQIEFNFAGSGSGPVFKSDGKVGIGTTSPATPLEIEAVNGVYDANLRLDSGGVNSNHHGLEWYAGSTKKATVTWGESDANLKIRNFRADANSSYGRIDFDVGDTSNPPTRMTVDGSTGNVGIGTTSPTQKLDVNGTVELNNLTVGGAQGSDGQVLTSTGSGVAWEDIPSAATLSSTAPSSPAEGDMWFNTSGSTVSFIESKSMAAYDGTKWVQMTTKFSAAGGTITTSGNYTVHTFTSSGTFTVTGNGPVEYLVIAGGGSGGAQHGGGGGAGGYRTASNFSVSDGAYTVTVGAGGAPVAGSANPNNGASGSNSVFGSITSLGGGWGQGWTTGGTSAGGSGGSGGGASLNGGGGSGTSGQGYAGGSSNGSSTFPNGGGGGGGSASVGENSTNLSRAGNGGSGTASSITGSSVTRAGGGGGGSHSPHAIGTGGSGGGGNGGLGNSGVGVDATVNTGSGGGGSGANTAISGAGGSGIVIVRYLT